MTKALSRALFILFWVANVHPIFADYQSSVEIRGAAFIPASQRFRNIYGDVGPSYQIEASTKLCNCLDGWANIDWFTKNGKSIGCKQSTRINIANLSFGIKYPFCICEKYTAYFGAGPSLGGVWLKNDSLCTSKHPSKWAFGVVLKSGINYSITQCIYLNVFVDYLFQPVHFDSNVDIGGLKTGLGIGMRF